jgi:YVTN family beta-propeller protein
MKGAKAQLVTIPYLLPLALMALGVRPAAAQQIYVANGFASDNLSLIDGDPTSPTYNTVVTTVFLDAPGCEIHVPKECSPMGIAITPDRTRVYVTDFAGGAVSVVSTATNTQVSVISFDPNPNNSDVWEPWGIAVTPDGRFAYVVGFNLAGGVSVIDADPTSPTYNTIVGHIAVPGSFARGLAITPDGMFAYMPFGLNSGGGGVAVISTTTNQVVATIPYVSGSVPDVGGIAITPEGRFAYVAGLDLGLLLEISVKRNTVVDTVTGLGRTAGVATSEKGRFVYVTNEDGVLVIRSTNKKVVATVPLDGGGRGIAITSDSKFAYVTGGGLNGTVSVIDTGTNTVITSIGVGSYPGGIAITPERDRAARVPEAASP